MIKCGLFFLVVSYHCYSHYESLVLLVLLSMLSFLSSGADLIHHPYYQIAEFYNPISPLSSIVTLKYSVDTVVGRLDEGHYYQETGMRSWIDPMAGHTGSPLQVQLPVEDRSNGFAISFWVYLDKDSRATRKSTLYNSGRAYDMNKVSVSITLISFKVISFNGKSL